MSSIGPTYNEVLGQIDRTNDRALEKSSPTYNHQLALGEIAKGILQDYDVEFNRESPGLWSRITTFLPSQEKAGKWVGEHVSQTYGTDCSNKMVAFVVSKFFAPQPKEWSLWDYFSRIPQTTVTEVAKLTMTPKIVPIMTLVAGTSGQIALPLIIGLVGKVYHDVIGDSSKAQQLAHLELSDLFTIDPETGNLRDAFGRVLQKKDTQDILAATAQYHIVEKMVQLCQKIDETRARIAETSEIIDEEKLEKGELSLHSLNFSDIQEQKTSEAIDDLIQSFIKTCYIEREDGTLVFPSGVRVTQEHVKVINEALTVLKSSSLKTGKNRKALKEAVLLIGEHAIYPMQLLKNTRLKDNTTTKRMPQVFQIERHEWKNHIVQAEDGVCFLAKDCGDRKAGTIISEEEMKDIVAEMGLIQKTIKRDQWLEFKDLLEQEEYSKLAESLNSLSKEQIGSFFKAHLIERKDGMFVYLNGEVLTQEDKKTFIKNIALMMHDKDLNSRKDKILELVKAFGAHMPQATAENYVIKCSDGVYLDATYHFKEISEEEAKSLEESMNLAKSHGFEVI